jgi:hypothetical protein
VRKFCDGLTGGAWEFPSCWKARIWDDVSPARKQLLTSLSVQTPLSTPMHHPCAVLEKPKQLKLDAETRETGVKGRQSYFHQASSMLVKKKHFHENFSIYSRAADEKTSKRS